MLAAAPTGKPVEMTDEDKAAIAELGKVLRARIVWSSSRLSGKHDIFIVNSDGSEKKPLTESDHVDWFPRFSPDGKQVLFTRSKMAWTSEADAHRNKRWDLFVINVDGTGEKKVVKDACWGNWVDGGKSILCARNDKILKVNIASGEEEILLDSSSGPLAGAVLQQPELSPDGKCLAITLRGRRRETGIWNREAGAWTRVGGGCQIAWFPDGKRIYWMNPTGNGGSEVLSTDVKDGAPVEARPRHADLRWVDLPGRRSHEYFPKVSADGKWLVWCATIYGHDHDIYDYEVFCWRISDPIEKAVRLTFHSGNDRWPDIFIVDEKAQETEQQ